MNKMKYYFLGLLMCSSVHSSPPCGISYSITVASQSEEVNLLNEVKSSMSSNDELTELHLSIPTTVNNLEIGSLVLNLQENGVRKLIVDVRPYSEEEGKNMYVVNINRELLPKIGLYTVFNEKELCGSETVNSSGKKYNLTKAITRLSN